MPGRTVHHRMSGRLTFSFSHLFELARELSISLDQSGRHSQNDLAVMTQFDDTALERTSRDLRPQSMDLGTQHARQRDLRFQRAFPHREAAAPAPHAIGSPRAMERRADQRPPEATATHGA